MKGEHHKGKNYLYKWCMCIILNIKLYLMMQIFTNFNCESSYYTIFPVVIFRMIDMMLH